MKHSRFAPCVCQACAAKVRRLDRQSARLSEALTPSVYERVSIDTMLALVNDMDALNRARYQVLHGCTHLN